MSPPQINATLTRVNAASSGEAFDGPKQPGAEEWAGSERVYYREVRDRVRTAEGENRVTTGELIVSTLSPARKWSSGELVTFTPDGDVEQTRTVKLVPRRDLAGVPATLRTTRLTLEAA